MAKIYNSKRTIWLMIAVVCFTLSCANDKEAAYPDPEILCDELETPSASSNSPVVIGGELRLSASDISGDANFEWTGPGGFFSELQNPVISDIQYQANGIYRVRAKKNTCTSSYMPTTVSVRPPCMGVLTGNSAMVDGITWNFYDQVNCGNTGPGGNFIVHCISNQGNLQISHSTSELPFPGFYLREVDPGDSPLFDTSKVRLIIIEGGIEFQAKSGFVYVGNDGINLQFSFCGLVFESTALSSRTISAKVQCD